MYRVHIGWTVNGRNRWKVFDTLEEAKTFCGEVFDRTKIVLSIVATNSRHIETN